MVIFYHSLISYLKYCQISPLQWLSWGIFKCIGKITTWLHNLTSSVFKITNWFFPNVTVFQIWPVRFFFLVSLLMNLNIFDVFQFIAVSCSFMLKLFHSLPVKDSSTRLTWCFRLIFALQGILDSSCIFLAQDLESAIYPRNPDFF